MCDEFDRNTNRSLLYTLLLLRSDPGMDGPYGRTQLTYPVTHFIRACVWIWSNEGPDTGQQPHEDLFNAAFLSLIYARARGVQGEPSAPPPATTPPVDLALQLTAYIHCD